MKKINIAIDGYSSCGKSTLAKGLAEIINYLYIDSGAMYRAVTLYALKHDGVINGVIDKEKILDFLDEVYITFQYNEETKCSETYLNNENVEKDIRDMEVAKYVSDISAIKEVREKLVNIQKKIASDKGVVMDGRDIGTVVLPEAELKIFMTADNKVRSQRRFKELQEKHIESTLQEVESNLNSRDKIDTNREVSPLIQAEDAEILDNTYLTIEEQLGFAINLVNQKVTA